MVSRSILALVFSLAGISCTSTEIPLSHDNPLDRIFDSGSFRMGLTGDTKGTGTSLAWSNVFHKTEGALSDSNLKLNSSAAVLRSATSPSASDLTAVKSATALSASFAQVAGCAVAVAGTSYAGSCESTLQGYFIIQFNYKFTDKAGVTSSGIIYSNFAAVP